jgi:hypothetical protein
VLAILFLLLAFGGALTLVQQRFADFPVLVRLVAAFGCGTVLTAWLTFGAASLFHALGRSDDTFYGGLVAIVTNLALVVRGRRELQPATLRVGRRDLLGVSAALAVSSWIMIQRLGGDPLQVSLNTWGDTGLHIGIARSFSQGDNFPPALPIFSGETIRYHFGFDFFAGALERLGLPIQWAFNLPGALGFTAIMVMLVELARYLWRSTAVGVVAAVLFVTNGSLAFLRYFALYPTIWEALKPEHWWNHDRYLAIGPFGGSEQISLFLTLNPYLTQTHLIVAMALVLFVGYALLRHLRGPGGISGAGGMSGAGRVTEDAVVPLPPGRAAALGLVSGAAFWFNGILFGASMVFFATLLFLHSGHVRRVAPAAAGVAALSSALFVVGSVRGSDGLRVAAVGVALGGLLVLGPLRRWWPFFGVAGLAAVPQVLWLNRGGSGAPFLFHTGYLVPNFRPTSPAAYVDLVGYWWLNLGLVLPLVVLAALVGRRGDRKLLLAIMSIFVLGNIVVLGTDVGGHNHKLFNLWETLVNLFAAYGLVWTARQLWHPVASGRGAVIVGRAVAVVVVPVLCVGLTLSGLIDFMTLKNDPRYDVFGDAEGAIAWMGSNTPRTAVFLTSYGDPYTVPTLAGRAVYVGGFGFWQQVMGYDHLPREELVKAVYDAPDRAAVCRVLAGTDISYVQYGAGESNPDRFPERNPNLFPGDFVKSYSDGRYAYFDVHSSCQGVTSR